MSKYDYAMKWLLDSRYHALGANALVGWIDTCIDALREKMDRESRGYLSFEEAKSIENGKPVYIVYFGHGEWYLMSDVLRDLMGGYGETVFYYLHEPEKTEEETVTHGDW